MGEDASCSSDQRVPKYEYGYAVDDPTPPPQYSSTNFHSQRHYSSTDPDNFQVEL